MISCDSSTAKTAQSGSQLDQAVTVGVTRVERRPLGRQLTISSELVPFQEIDVYAKESGFVSRLLVDYGTHVQQGQLLAVLEIPELEAQLQQDEADIKSMQDQVTNAQHQLGRVEAQRQVLHLEYERLNNVAQTRPGLVAQQEVDDTQGRDLAAAAQVEAARANWLSSQSNLAASQAKLIHDQAIYSYSRITAPFSGVVTERYANLGTLVQAGTSSTQALPIVKLSQESLYRLVIPVPESYVPYIKIGDPVDVRVPSLDKHFPGKLARISYELRDSTRTLHTEVDVPNPRGELLPGVYAEATLTLNRSSDVLAVPLQAIERQGEQSRVLEVDSTGRIESREVALGIETDNYAEVLSGLRAGAQVVVSDRSGLKAGQVVRAQLTPAATYHSGGEDSN